jgi:hypothetical protein
MTVRHLVIFLLATILPNFIIGPILGFLRTRSVELPKDLFWKYWSEASFGYLTFAIGFTERAVAIVLFVFAPSALLPFVGGWMAVKYAARWQEIYGARAREETLIALVGTAWSLSTAVVAAYFIRDQALAYFTK